ncbi:MULTISPECIES: CmpA/NrtA family ABC transporter substrate-binding protein [Rhodomicrobium]|uniref:CmpA/NrtA family ABC transporter substrate-binding protein n=1 Tax=Rhodomicrobium TaxID=1068 RepID=UPI000B4A68CC|nr:MULTISPECIES: CmpA/NrtA family ABC transporter substrate-binding protein [Rhodomicrobium]
MPDDTEDGGLPIIHAGFIPLVDCAPLVVAARKGFDTEQGFSLRLHKEASWANIRDKLEMGIFDCAHLLAPMAIASTLGLGRPPTPVIAPMALNLNGNVIVVSEELFAEMHAADPADTDAGGMRAAWALARVVTARRAAGAIPLTLGMVYPFSCHNYDMRCWLASAGIDPDNDVNLVVIPPPLIADSLAEGRIDGFCVGAPWGRISVEAGQGRIIAAKNHLWPNSPEKVLGVREDWAAKKPDLLIALVCALLKAAAWLEDRGNFVEAAHLLAEPRHIGVAEPMLYDALAGNLVRAKGEAARPNPDFLVFSRYAANFPWLSHAEWMVRQMERWRQIEPDMDPALVARQVYRPDIFRLAAARLGLSAPLSDSKDETLAGPSDIPGSLGPIRLGGGLPFGVPGK